MEGGLLTSLCTIVLLTVIGGAWADQTIGVGGERGQCGSRSVVSSLGVVRMIARCCGWVSLQASDSELGEDIFLPAAVPVVLPCCATRAQTEVDGASDFRVFEGTLRSQVVCLVPYVPCAMPTTRTERAWSIFGSRGIVNLGHLHS